MTHISDQKEQIEPLRHVFVSRQIGKDTDTCGSDTEPCKTLVKAFGIASRGLHVHIDGTGTAQDPYDCVNMSTVIVFNTDWSSKGLTHHLTFYCKFGVNIVAPKESGLVTLKNLVKNQHTIGLLTTLNCHIQLHYK
ncbi:hypothetical protein OS493_032532 [Desmophyllum pertusum]|uniref:Uncharacterized protein n=1 Tax=Desmophyllum pertusum TaxID=174260 RepID=A0A9W9YYH4_9CNID|nr:hypothetical protein OS493_032532 [Desmophyllum pertusum]